MLKSINPATGEIMKEYDELNSNQINNQIKKSYEIFNIWKKTRFFERIDLIRNVSENIRLNKNKYASIITKEMGKPIIQSEEEIEKCALVCKYYIEKGELFLENQIVEKEEINSYVNFTPLGIILGIMPWNFPFWQVFRFVIPSLIAGNVILIKHSSNVPQCAIEIEKIFKNNGLPPNVFKTLLISSKHVIDILKNDRISAISLTGSSTAGSNVAGIAGKNLKKTVLELGGSDPFIVLSDADLKYTVDKAVKARMINNGQSCIAAKRFIIENSIFNDFKDMYIEKVEKLRVGDPLKRSTDIGPLAREDIKHELEIQVNKSVKKGAFIETGGKIIKNNPGFFYLPTVLSEIKEDMPVFNEETFGPVAPLLNYKNEKEAIRIANNTSYGLGSSIWTNDTKKGEELSRYLNAGNVFINEMVKSDPSLPFGGIKKSGFGRELSYFGIREFVNIKTIYIKNLKNS